jgi:hypothetical protein
MAYRPSERGYLLSPYYLEDSENMRKILFPQTPQKLLMQR